MVRRKNIRERGKVKFSRYFQKLEKGDSVAVVKESAMQPRFPKRLQGKTGKVKSARGKAYVVKIKDGNKYNEFFRFTLNS